MNYVILTQIVKKTDETVLLNLVANMASILILIFVALFFSKRYNPIHGLVTLITICMIIFVGTDIINFFEFTDISRLAQPFDHAASIFLLPIFELIGFYDSSEFFTPTIILSLMLFVFILSQIVSTMLRKKILRKRKGLRHVNPIVTKKHKDIKNANDYPYSPGDFYSPRYDHLSNSSTVMSPHPINYKNATNVVNVTNNNSGFSHPLPQQSNPRMNTSKPMDLPINPSPRSSFGQSNKNSYTGVTVSNQPIDIPVSVSQAQTQAYAQPVQPFTQQQVYSQPVQPQPASQQPQQSNESGYLNQGGYQNYGPQS